MFISWGSKWKYEKKLNGLKIDKKCPECSSFGEFFEVIPKKYFTLYWIPIPLVKRECIPRKLIRS